MRSDSLVISRKIKESYKNISREYALAERKIWPEMKPWLREIDKDMRVLDVGCGEGRILSSIPLGVDYSGIDFSEELIALARKRYGQRKKVKFMLADINKKESWEDLDKFDFIFALAIIHHLPFRDQQLRLLKRIKEHLKRGGTAYISVWNLQSKKYWREHLRCLSCKFGNWKNLPDSLRWVEIPFRKSKQKRFYTALGKRYLRNLLIESGFKRFEFVWGKRGKNLWIIGKA